MIATIVKHQWFSGSPLPLNEWFGRNHWYQWFFNGFWSINHWPRCFFSLATIGLDGFAMVFGLATIGLDGFSMVANHWSNDGMVTIHRYGLLADLSISICSSSSSCNHQIAPLALVPNLTTRWYFFLQSYEKRHFLSHLPVFLGPIACHYSNFFSTNVHLDNNEFKIF